LDQQATVENKANYRIFGNPAYESVDGSFKLLYCDGNSKKPSPQPKPITVYCILGLELLGKKVEKPAPTE